MFPSILPSLFFSCARTQVERLNRYRWLMAQTTRFDTRKCLLGMRRVKKYFKGVFDPKNRRFFRPSREVTAKTSVINNFQTVQFGHLLIMYDKEEIMPNLSESAKTFSPQCPLAEIFEIIFRCPMLRTAVQCKIGRETD